MSHDDQPARAMPGGGGSGPSGAVPGSPSGTAPGVTRVRWLPIVVFYVLACALAWLVISPLWISGKGLQNPLMGVLSPLMMYTPAVAALFVVMVVQRVRGRAVLASLGMWPIRPLKRTLLLALAALVGTALLPIVVTFIAAGLGLVRLDLVNFSGFAQVLQSQMPAGQTYPLSVRTTVIVQLVMLLPASATNAMFTVGEEIGWRGFLMSSLRPLGTWPALVISGAMWGLWHAPLILLGYDFGRRDALGVLLMIVSCVILGTLFGWLRIRSGNIWPSVFGHAALNGTAGFLGLVVAAGESPSVLATSPLGWIGWTLVALVVVVLALAGQFRGKDQWAVNVAKAPAVGPSPFQP
ncbi:CPBP family intramembrane glutamic endopeptidase [Propionibacterium freudenreichii]|uniref:CPBP family intramembrane glutamic endopeptidase n=2 Tax=Propionibacteriaceae TaxID=31957 RepID=UPI0021A5D48D|nr:type II CAAX endopeptidase family protein [Propionibacterium freudenreichii]